MNIVPLKNKYNEVTHFAAIERDVSSSKFQSEQLEKRNQSVKVLKNDLELLVQSRTLELQMAKSKLEQIAFFDPLTNSPNRRFFIVQANKMVNSCLRRGGIVVFGLLDIDNFKAINDTYGHDVGDIVLVALAELLRENFRDDDVYCRFGGEEFAFAAVIDGESGAAVIAEKLVIAIRQLGCTTPSGQYIKVTASLGLNVCTAEPEFDFDEKIKQTDIAMYQAKQSGKDRYCVFKQES